MWELLYETFWDRLEHFCYKLCRDEARAEDLTQEVFLRALQNRTLIDAFTERQCKAWLFAAARNLYCDQVRRAAKEEALLTSLLPPDGDDSADETAASALGSVDWAPCWISSPNWTACSSPCATTRAIRPPS